MNILFQTLAGSKLYGTYSDKSDTDIKGVFLPSIEECILGKTPKTICESTGSEHDRNNSNDVDKTFYSLQYFLQLAAAGETNCIDILFAHTNNEAIQVITPTWKILIDNIDKIITKNMNSYLGFCRSQCQRYSFKGDKLNNYNAFANFCKCRMNNKDENGAPETLGKALSDLFGVDVISKNTNIDSEERVSIFKEYYQGFGEHAYFVQAKNKEQYIQISSVKFCLFEPTKSAYHKCLKVINSYGQRAINAANANGADMKAISHCVRVLFQVEEILDTGKISFPLKEREFIKSIKYNTTKLSFDEIMDWINIKMDYINKKIEESDLREKVDHKWINNFILDCYKKGM